MRAVIFLLFVVLVFFVLRFTLNRVIAIRERQRAAAENTPKTKEAQNQASSNPQEMVRCAECGVHLPQSEAYYDGKDTFCSEGHMHAFHEKNDNPDN